MQLTYGAQDAFNALVYGEQNPQTTNHLRSQFERATNLLGDAGRRFYESALSTFEHYNSNAAINFARTAIQNLTGGNIDVQRVVYLHEVEQLRAATQLMQRYLMANPVVRERYLDQRLDGYSETYVNVHGTDVGWHHYDYRRVVEGVGQTDKEGDEHWTEFFDELHEGDRHLTLSEKIDIMDSWSAQNVLLALCEDPTDPEGGKL
jgi:hypothetical protein